MINAQLQFKTIHDRLARFQDRLLSVEIGHLPSGEGEIAVFEGMHVQRVEQIDSDERSFSGSGTKMFLFAPKGNVKGLITVYEQLLDAVRYDDAGIRLELGGTVLNLWDTEVLKRDAGEASEPHPGPEF